MKIFKKNYPNNALLMGAGLMLVALCVPVISEPITNIVTSIRSTISGFLKKKQ